MALVVDTSFLVDVNRGHDGAVDALDEASADGELLILPTVVVAEYLTGSTDPPRALEMLRAAGEIVELTIRDAVEAGTISRKTRADGRFPGWSDVLIGGTARNRGDVPVLTGNPEHFPENETRTYRP